MRDFIQFQKVGDYHKFANLKAPLHPLISLVDYSQIQYPPNVEEIRWTQDYYVIGLKRNVAYKFFYGQQEYDFDEGVMTFISPKQIMSLSNNPNAQKKPSGWLLLIHPDFFWKSSLAKKIDSYDFFGYNINEALFLSEKEEHMMIEILSQIRKEYESNIDKFSQSIIISQIELILNYAQRFYERQFITRQISNHHIILKLEKILDELFEENELSENGLPSVQKVSEKLNISSNYLSNLLSAETGQTTLQHIHNRLIRIAKLKLSHSTHSISEIAYELGFDYPASFSKLFKNKTKMSPVEFRKSFR